MTDPPIDGSDADATAEPGSPWLSDRQQLAWRSYLAMWRILEARIERDMQRSAGMPLAYYLILAMLSEAPDRRLRMNKLSEIVGFSQSRLSHAISRLEEFGWVRREQVTADKRGQSAVLTDRGWDRLLQVSPEHAETVRGLMFDPLSEEQLTALDDIVTTILAAVPSVDGEPQESCPDLPAQ